MEEHHLQKAEWSQRLSYEAEQLTWEWQECVMSDTFMYTFIE